MTLLTQSQSCLSHFITIITQLPSVLQYTVIYLPSMTLSPWGKGWINLPVDVGSQVANASGYRALLWVPMKAHVWR